MINMILLILLLLLLLILIFNLEKYIIGGANIKYNNDNNIEYNNIWQYSSNMFTYQDVYFFNYYLIQINTKAHEPKTGYIVTYNNIIFTNTHKKCLDELYYILSFFYSSNKTFSLPHSNVCTKNNIFNFLNQKKIKDTFIRNMSSEIKILIKDINTSKIIICPDTTYDNNIIKLLNKIYGVQDTIIDARYHTLLYFIIKIQYIKQNFNMEYHIAVETTSKFKILDIETKLQYCIANTKNDLESLLKLRYQYKKIRYE